jgi:MFS family permease
MVKRGKKASDDEDEEEQLDILNKKKTMALSIKEGAVASVSTGTGSYFITPYAIALGFNNLQIGIFNSIASLLPPLFQYKGSRMMETWNRKKLITTFVTLQALMWFPMLLLAWLFWRNLFVSYLPYLLIIFYTLLATFGAIAGPAWFSMMGDIVPDDHRGRYFGKRNRITDFVVLVTFVASAFMLDYFKTHGMVLIGFSLIFFIAGIFRLISASMLSKYYDPKFKTTKDYYFSFGSFLREIWQHNFSRFSLFYSMFYFAVSVGGSFFDVYMLRYLGFSYISYMVVVLSTSVFSLLSWPLWGKISDICGNKKLMAIGAIMVSAMPFFWIFHNSPIYLALVPQMLSGAGWAALGLASSNFIYDVVSKPKRALCLSYHNMLVGALAFIGAIIGGLLAQYLPNFQFSNLLILFAITGVLRLAVALIFLPHIDEVKKVKNADISKMFLRYINPIERTHNLLFISNRFISKGFRKLRKEISF